MTDEQALMTASPHYLIGYIRGTLAGNLMNTEQKLDHIRLALAEYDAARDKETL